MFRLSITKNKIKDTSLAQSSIKSTISIQFITVSLVNSYITADNFGDWCSQYQE